MDIPFGGLAKLCGIAGATIIATNGSVCCFIVERVLIRQEFNIAVVGCMIEERVVYRGSIQWLAVDAVWHSRVSRLCSLTGGH